MGVLLFIFRRDITRLVRCWTLFRVMRAVGLTVATAVAKEGLEPCAKRLWLGFLLAGGSLARFSRWETISFTCRSSKKERNDGLEWGEEGVG